MSTTAGRLAPRSSFIPAIALVALVAALGACANDAQAPTAPEPAATAPRATAAATAASLVFRSISAGQSYTCGVTKDNLAWCWGSNFSGQLGDGTETQHVLPVPVAGGLHFRTISTGSTQSCGITTR